MGLLFLENVTYPFDQHHAKAHAVNNTPFLAWINLNKMAILNQHQYIDETIYMKN